MRWLDGITDLMDIGLIKLMKTVEDRSKHDQISHNFWHGSTDSKDVLDRTTCLARNLRKEGNEMEQS